MIEEIVTSKAKIHTIIEGFLYVYQEGFTRVIWRERCEKIKEWEISIGISKEMKERKKAFMQRRKINQKRKK